MKIKLDENLGVRCQEVLKSFGHEVCTVAQQELQGFADHALIERCASEERCLVTLDLDFANPLVFRPSEYHGIAVLRLPSRCVHADLLTVAATLGQAMLDNDIRGRLWIVQANRVRIYDPDQ